MAGDVQNILPVCQSWEDHVWAYYHCLLDAEIDQVRFFKSLAMFY